MQRGYQEEQRGSQGVGSAELKFSSLLWDHLPLHLHPCHLQPGQARLFHAPQDSQQPLTLLPPPPACKPSGAGSQSTACIFESAKEEAWKS